MTDPNQQNLSPSPEAATRSVEAIVKEWRQVAIAEGIAPTKVDQYLLDRTDVPEDVKVFIRKQLSEQESPAGRVSRSAAEMPPPPEMVTPHATSAEAVVPEKGPQESTEIKGEVGMLDSRSEIESIKREVIEPSEAETRVEVAERKADLPSTEPDTKEALSEEGPGARDIRERDPSRMGPVATGVYGYAPSEEVARNADEIAEKGSVSDAKTWQAELIRRFIQIWGNLKGLFSQ